MFEGIYQTTEIRENGDVATAIILGQYSVNFLSGDDGWVGMCAHQELTDTFNNIDNNIIVAVEEQDYTPFFEEA